MKISYYADKKVPFYKKKQFLTTVVGLFFIMLMALSAVQFNQAGPESGEESVINGLTFIDTTSGWRADLDSGPLYLQSEPSSLEDVGAEEVDFSIFSLSSKVYVSLDPYDSVAKSAAAEILRNVVMPVQVVYSCYEDSEVCADMPLKTCEDATKAVAVIVIKEAEETVTRFEGNCLIMEGKDLLKVADKLLVQYYGER